MVIHDGITEPPIEKKYVINFTVVLSILYKHTNKNTI